MGKDMIVRAWKDAQYRANLTPDQLAAIGSHPAGEGLGELDETELRGIAFGISDGVATITVECYVGTLVFACC